jgi:hypothetical protein
LHRQNIVTATRFHQQRMCRIQRFLPDIGDYKFHAGTRESQRDAESDAVCATGNERNLPFNLIHVFVLFVS